MNFYQTLKINATETRNDIISFSGFFFVKTSWYRQCKIDKPAVCWIPGCSSSWTSADFKGHLMTPESQNEHFARSQFLWLIRVMMCVRARLESDLPPLATGDHLCQQPATCHLSAQQIERRYLLYYPHVQTNQTLFDKLQEAVSQCFHCKPHMCNSVYRGHETWSSIVLSASHSQIGI